MVKKQRRKATRKFIKQSNIVSDDIFIPNHSGTHDAGTIHKTPINDFDIPNKAYVDSVAGVFDADVIVVLDGAVATLDGNVLILQ